MMNDTSTLVPTQQMDSASDQVADQSYSYGPETLQTQHGHTFSNRTNFALARIGAHKGVSDVATRRDEQ